MLDKVLSNDSFKDVLTESVKAEIESAFNEAVEITVRFDNPNFNAGGKLNNKLEAKKVMNLPISYKPINNENGNTGRCIITVNKLPSWVYYLSAE